jgi:2-isopropylmalate synthase
MGDKTDGKGMQLQYLEVISGTANKPKATVKLRVNGAVKTATTFGNGPVDAAYNAINSLVKKKVGLEEYLVQAITGGSDDVGKVHIQLKYKGNLYHGFAADTDIITASVKAYVDGLNKII